MGSSFRLIRLVYALDGTQVFARSEDTSPNLYKTKSFDILTGPISPGSHSISALAVYRGHGYGVFKYLNKYTFTVRASHTFTAAEGKVFDRAPDSARTLDVLGSLRNLQDDLPGAVEAARQAVALEPDSALYRSSLAARYLGQERADAAAP